MAGGGHITVVDYGTGNLASVCRKLVQAGAHAELTADPARVRQAEKLVLPGVGHFGQTMARLETRGLRQALDHAARTRRVPVLGICLGMQLMARHSAEGGVDGLGWLDAEVVPLAVADRLRNKVPHIGWSQVTLRRRSPLMREVPPDAEFYFVHSFNLEPRSTDVILGETVYASTFVSAVAADNLYGVQFHPEKSHDVGELLFKNFVEL
jgi:glutamine amidotransferase